MTGVYQIKNVVNNKIYIGSSNNLMRRIQGHKCILRKNKHHNCYLQRAWNKYGENNFKFEIVECCELEKITEREQYWIDFYKSYKRNIGYNIDENVEHVFLSEEVKEKMKLNHADFTGSNNPNSKLNWSVVEEIRKKYTKGISECRMAKEYGVLPNCISRIVRNISWKDENYITPTNVKKDNSKINFGIAKEIRNKYQTKKYSYGILAKEYNISKSTIQQVIKLRIWKEPT